MWEGRNSRIEWEVVIFRKKNLHLGTASGSVDKMLAVQVW